MLVLLPIAIEGLEDAEYKRAEIGAQKSGGTIGRRRMERQLSDNDCRVKITAPQNQVEVRRSLYN